MSKSNKPSSNNNAASQATSAAALIKKLDGLHLEFGSWRKRYQGVLIEVILHVIKYHDTRPVQHLVNCMVDETLTGTDRQALVKWLEEYACCYIIEGDNKGEQVVSYNAKGRTDINAVGPSNKDKGAKAMNWWAFKPSKPFEGFNLHEEVQKLKSKAAKMGKKTGADGELVIIDVNEARMLTLIQEGKADVLMAMYDASVPATVVSEVA